MGAGPGGDFNETARQAWTAWSNLLRGMGATPPAAAPAWPDATAWWAQMAGAPPPAPEHPAEALMRGLRDQAGGWFAQMQQLATQFAGRDASATDIASAWKQMVGGHAAQSFTDVFASMSRPGAQGMEQWIAQIQPLMQMLHSMQAAQTPGDARAWMGLPTFGFAREHQARWQQLAIAQLEHQDRSRAFADLMNDAAQQAFVVFERKLGERSTPGQQIESTRALFDLWVDAAEEAYAEFALSPRFRESYGALVDSQMRLRSAVQREIELTGELLGTPTRTEVDAAHRKIVQLEREVRRLRDAVEGLRSAQASGAAAGGAGEPAAAASAQTDTAVGSNARQGAEATAGTGKPARSAKVAAAGKSTGAAGNATKRKSAAGTDKTRKAR